MLIPAATTRTDTIADCHAGIGSLLCRTILREGDAPLAIRFVHDDLIEPGASIGEHTHTDDEELYLVISGHGTMIMDGVRTPIGPGDASLVTPGHSHGLINGPDEPMRLIVVCVKPA